MTIISSAYGCLTHTQSVIFFSISFPRHVNFVNPIYYKKIDGFPLLVSILFCCIGLVSKVTASSKERKHTPTSIRSITQTSCHAQGIYATLIESIDLIRSNFHFTCLSNAPITFSKFLPYLSCIFIYPSNCKILVLLNHEYLLHFLYCLSNHALTDIYTRH